MLAQARAELPNECCGLFTGRLLPGEPPLGDVRRRYALVNAAASPVEYLSDDASMFGAWRDWHRHADDILAVYHSHPTSDPIPSRTDRERNYSTDVVNLIISLKIPEPTVRGWWLTADDSREA